MRDDLHNLEPAGSTKFGSNRSAPTRKPQITSEIRGEQRKMAIAPHGCSDSTIDAEQWLFTSEIWVLEGNGVRNREKKENRERGHSIFTDKVGAE